MQPSSNPPTPSKFPPRTATPLGIWSFAPFIFKIYGLCLHDDMIDEALQTEMRRLMSERVAGIRVARDQNILGFAIIHKGTEGTTLSLYWWVEDCILCHDHVRRSYSGTDGISSMRTHVVGCVWELDLIGFEKTAWQRTMMSAAPDAEAYLQDLAAYDPHDRDLL